MSTTRTASTVRTAAPVRAWAFAAVTLVSIGDATQPAGAQQFSVELDRICEGDRLEFALPAFERFDADGNGTIETEEVSRCNSLRELFERLDLDADGGLTREEYAGYADLWERHVRSLGERGTDND